MGKKDTCAQVEARRSGSHVCVAGIVLVRQRPGTGNVIFVTLEDEIGITNAVLWVRTLEAHRLVVIGARLMTVEGVIEKSPEGGVRLMAERLHDHPVELNRLSSGDESEGQAPGDEEIQRHRHPKNLRILPRSRNFH